MSNNKKKTFSVLEPNKREYDDTMLQRKKENKNEILQLNFDLINLENSKIVKSNELIQKGIFDLTERQQKIINFFMTNKEIKTATDQTSIKYFYKDLLIALKLNDSGRNYQDIQNEILDLLNKNRWVSFYDKDNNHITANFSFLIYVELVNKNYLEIQFSKRFLSLIQYQKNKFTQYLYWNTMNLAGKYSIRFYELMKSWEKEKKFTMYIDFLITNLSIPKSYAYKDIKKRIIIDSIMQINDKTDLYINPNFREIKNGKKVIAIELEINSKKGIEQIKLFDKLENERKDRLVELGKTNLKIFQKNADTENEKRKKDSDIKNLFIASKEK